MEIIRKEFSYPSVTGQSDIYARAWVPEGEIKAVFQLIHGMAEHGERYEPMAKVFCEAGYVFAVNDHVGHGRSVKDQKDWGFFGSDKNKAGSGFVDDAHKFTLLLKETYQKPVVLMGHSMGSFVARSYIAKYAADIEGAVICGTSGPQPTGAGAFLAGLTAKIKGERTPGKLVDKIAFGAYNKRCPGRTPFDWLTTDEAVVDKYVADPACGFMFSASGYKNMMELLGSVSNAAWFGSVPKDLPLLLIAGAEDPVGAYGKGVTAVCEKLKAAGVKDVSMKLYKGARHEIHNEFCKDEVFADILAFCGKVLAD